MKCLVTGGAGFIGSNLAIELEAQGYDVIIVDNLFSGNKENLREFKGIFIKADIADPQFDIEEKIDAIFHEAAITDPRHPDDSETYQKNIEGFKNVIKLAKKNNAKLVYASTAGLYGNGYVPMEEGQEKDVLTSYGKSKWDMDLMAEKIASTIHIVGLRYFNVFGPKELHKGRPASMIYHLGKQMRQNEKPRLFKYGQQIRDYIYVKDAVTATIKALDAKSDVYNVGTGIGTSFIDLVQTINSVFGKKLEPEYFDMPYDAKSYQNNTQADIKKAETGLHFKAAWNLKDAITDYFAYLDKHGWDL